MKNDSIWPETKTPLYKVGDYVVYEGVVLKVAATSPLDSTTIPYYDAFAIYSPGDYCCYEGKPYMYIGKAEATPDGPFNPENGTEPPIYAVRE